jgi:hypothetical protein
MRFAAVVAPARTRTDDGASNLRRRRQRVLPPDRDLDRRSQLQRYELGGRHKPLPGAASLHQRHQPGLRPARRARQPAPPAPRGPHWIAPVADPLDRQHLGQAVQCPREMGKPLRLSSRRPLHHGVALQPAPRHLSPAKRVGQVRAHEQPDEQAEDVGPGHSRAIRPIAESRSPRPRLMPRINVATGQRARRARGSTTATTSRNRRRSLGDRRGALLGALPYTSDRSVNAAAATGIARAVDDRAAARHGVPTSFDEQVAQVPVVGGLAARRPIAHRSRRPPDRGTPACRLAARLSQGDRCGGSRRRRLRRHRRQNRVPRGGARRGRGVAPLGLIIMVPTRPRHLSGAHINRTRDHHLHSHAPLPAPRRLTTSPVAALTACASHPWATRRTSVLAAKPWMASPRPPASRSPEARGGNQLVRDGKEAITRLGYAPFRRMPCASIQPEPVAVPVARGRARRPCRQTSPPGRCLLRADRHPGREELPGDQGGRGGAGGQRGRIDRAVA